MKAMLLALLMVMLTNPVIADAESERTNLSTIVGEIDYLLRTLQAYPADAPTDQYIFDYGALSRDLQAMRQGIVEYIERDLSLAREIPPLEVEYTHDAGGHP